MTLSDVNYDIISALQNKLDAITVYDQYVEDCREAGEDDCRQAFEQIRVDEERHAENLRDLLEKMVKAGKFH